MTPRISKYGPFSLSGVPLEGTKLMRLIYVDEAGISIQEPFIVVAAVIAVGDTDVTPVSRHLSKMIERWIPEDQRPGFVFHANQIFGGTKEGSGKVFERNNPDWNKKRLLIADELAAIPRKFGLKLAWGAVERASFPDSDDGREQWESLSLKDKLVFPHVVAFLNCSLMVDFWMRQHASNEICMMIVEDNSNARAMIRDTQTFHQDPKSVATLPEDSKQYFPLRKIKEDPAFQSKKPDSLLTIADFVAYVLKRRLMRDDFYDRFMTPLQAALVPSWNELKMGKKRA